MARILMVRQPTRAEFRRLNELIEDAPTRWQRQKAHAVVLYATGMHARDIAAALGVHPNTVYATLQAFGQGGLPAVQETAPRGAPARIAAQQVAEIRRIAEKDPIDRGEPYGHWSLATLRTHLIRRRVVRKISREHLRQLLKKGVSTGAVSNAN
jgi:transposase